MRVIISTFLCLMSWLNYADDDNVVNIYIWAGMPNELIQEFEQETGISVNIATYDTNETMYAKLKANPTIGYDVVQPSSYFLEKMRNENMLEKLNKKLLPNVKNLDPRFANPGYDPGSLYSIPYSWGVTGMFINRARYPHQRLKKWIDLWQPDFRNEVLLINDVREVFAIASFALGNPVDEADPPDIEQCYQLLVKLLPNVKLFSGDSRITILSDQDGDVGMAWNADVFKAKVDNPQLEFVYPDDTFVLWNDNFAIPLYAPHKANAYRFIDFMLRAESAKKFSLALGNITTVLTSLPLLPKKMREDPVFNPPDSELKRAVFQRALSPTILELYQEYWERLKS
jgi:spermidine/putrescine transport system substrate-binding protein